MDNHPFKVAAVELLIRGDMTMDDVFDNILRPNLNSEPLCEYRQLGTVFPISGPDAEDRFEQPDLEYPGKISEQDRVQRVLQAGKQILDQMDADPTKADTAFISKLARLALENDNHNTLNWLEGYLKPAKAEERPAAKPIVTPLEIRLMALLGSLDTTEKVIGIMSEHLHDSMPAGFVERVEKVIRERLGDVVMPVGWKQELDKLKEFKTYVHKRLTDMGVHENPCKPGETCRVGARLDILFQELCDLRADADTVDKTLRHLGIPQEPRAEDAMACTTIGKRMKMVQAKLRPLSISEIKSRWEAAGGTVREHAGSTIASMEFYGGLAPFISQIRQGP